MDNNSIAKDFIGKIRELRQTLHYSTKEMGECFNASQGTYRRYEKGKMLPGFFSLYAAASRLGLSLDWLVCGRGPVYYQEKEEKKIEDTAPPSLREVPPAEIAQLLEHMNRSPLLRHEVLAFYYKFMVEHKELAAEPPD
jgi:transcriptional regulator with XRE-family HTH domain